MNESFIIGCCLLECSLAYVENADDSSLMSKYHLQKGGAISNLRINSIMKYVKLLFEQLSFKFTLIFFIFYEISLTLWSDRAISWTLKERNIFALQGF
jgi:hypothetical protein